MKFIVRDENANAVTNTVTSMHIDRTASIRGLAFGEYISDFTLSTFTNLNQLRCDFIFYPEFGSNVLDTTLNTYTGITRMPTGITNLNDRLMTYSDQIAVVSASGDDTNGRTTNVAPASVNSAHYFLTISGAAAAIKGSNNILFAHNDVGGGHIYVRDGVTNWLGGSQSTVGTPKAVVTIENYPGETPTITTRLNNNDISDRMKIVGINFNIRAAQVPFSGIEFLWFYKCPSIISTSTAPIQTCTLTWMISCGIGFFDQGLRPSSGANNTSFILRDCNLDDFRSVHKWNLTMGCMHPTNGPGYSLIMDVAGQTTPAGFEILYNNAFYGGTGAGTFFTLAGDANRVMIGSAVVNNIFEYVATSTGPVGSLGSSASGLDTTNCIVWNNVFVGERIADVFSSSSATTNKNRVLHSMRNNIIDLSGFKKDYDPTADADRLGDWGVMFQSGCSGNSFLECRVNSAAGGFPPDFAGLQSYHPVGGGTNVMDYARWVRRAAFDGAGAQTSGAGNYRLQSRTAIHRVHPIIQFDIDGYTLGLSDFTGPSASGNIRRGAMF